jgi:hypothetical protein
MDNINYEEEEIKKERVDLIFKNDSTTVKIGDKAPLFHATTTFGHIKLTDYTGKWLVLFSHPRRFYTSVYN